MHLVVTLWFQVQTEHVVPIGSALRDNPNRMGQSDSFLLKIKKVSSYSKKGKEFINNICQLQVRNNLARVSVSYYV